MTNEQFFFAFTMILIFSIWVIGITISNRLDTIIKLLNCEENKND